MGAKAFVRTCWLLSAIFLGAWCAAAPLQATVKKLTPGDIAWLQRISFGVSSIELAQYRKLGRTAFLDRQLAFPGDAGLPPEITALVGSYEAVSTPVATLAAELRESRQAIKAMPAGEAQLAAKKALRLRGRALVLQAQQATLLRAIYGADQLNEQMVWFWLNHFSVYAGKGGVPLAAADYAENVIRPHALGKFRDLLMATLQSPAMLLFLDNAKNVKDKTNENYARELMELHTLGVGSGYSQQDVQQLTLILTGAGLAYGNGAGKGWNKAAGRQQPEGSTRHGLFVFDPDKHDFSDKVFLGQTIKGSGVNEIADAVDLIVKQPACATFISRQLATYFVADKPSATLVDAMAKTFRQTDGDIAALLRTLFLSKQLTASLRSTSPARKFKDPTQFLVSAIRLAYDGRPVTNALPLVNWLNQMGEPVFGRITPDGWPLDGGSWSSSGQLARRFDVAHAIGSGKNSLFANQPGPAARADPPGLDNVIFQQTIDPGLSVDVRTALKQAASPAEWNTFLLSSPDFNYR